MHFEKLERGPAQIYARMVGEVEGTFFIAKDEDGQWLAASQLEVSVSYPSSAPLADGEGHIREQMTETAAGVFAVSRGVRLTFAQGDGDKLTSGFSMARGPLELRELVPPTS